MSKYNLKLKTLANNIQNWNQLIQCNLYNLSFYLNIEKFTVFSKWVLLNQAVNEILGKSSGGLRNVHNSKPLVYQGLLNHVSAKFIEMSPDNELKLTEHKRTFLNVLRRYAILSYILKAFSNNLVTDMTDAYRAIYFFKKYTTER